MQDELLLGGEQRKTASTGSINSPTAASGWSRGTPPALLARPAQKSERLQCLDACRGLNVALMILVDNIGINHAFQGSAKRGRKNMSIAKTPGRYMDFSLLLPDLPRRFFASAALRPQDSSLKKSQTRI